MPCCVPCSDLKCSTRPLLVSIKTSETGIRMHSYLRKPHTRFIAPHKRHTYESYVQNTSQQTWLRLVRRSPSFVCCFRSFGCVDFCSSCSWSRAVPVFWFDVLLLASSFLRPFGWGSNLASPLLAQVTQSLVTSSGPLPVSSARSSQPVPGHLS
jgi:hypothetical protein